MWHAKNCHIVLSTSTPLQTAKGNPPPSPPPPHQLGEPNTVWLRITPTSQHQHHCYIRNEYQTPPRPLSSSAPNINTTSSPPAAAPPPHHTSTWLPGLASGPHKTQPPRLLDPLRSQTRLPARPLTLTARWDPSANGESYHRSCATHVIRFTTLLTFDLQHSCTCTLDLEFIVHRAHRGREREGDQEMGEVEIVRPGLTD